jgi:hypothetical protein
MVLAVVVPVAVLALTVAALFRVMDMDALLDDLARPKVVPTAGQILFQGKPLPNAQVMTQPVSARGVPAIGWTDDEGNFTLKTDIRGSYVEGATVGEHRVAVTAHAMIPTGPAAPPLITPSNYASVGSSPLQITIAPDAAKNQFQLVLEGEAPARTQGSGGSGRGKGKGKGKASAETESADSVQNTPDASDGVDESTTNSPGASAQRGEAPNE